MTEWQDISTAPKDKREIILYNYEGIYLAWWNGDYWDTGCGCDEPFDSGDVENPTHWMPLPLPPPSKEML